MACVLIALAAGALAQGCGTARVKQPLTTTLPVNASQTEFWHQLYDRPLVSNDEAFHALLMYLDGKHDGRDYAGRVAAMKARGLLPEGFDKPADEAIDKGTLGLALVRVLDLRGGLTMTLLGPSERYAVRTLQHHGVYPASSPNQVLSGEEFVAIIGRVVDARRGDTVGSSAEHLRVEPTPVASAATLRAPVKLASWSVTDLKPLTKRDLLTESGEDSRELEELRGFSLLPLVTGNDAPPLFPMMMLIAEPETRPATVPATGPAAGPPAIRIRRVEGNSVEVRLTEGGLWQPAREGMTLRLGSGLRTGPDGVAMIEIAPVPVNFQAKEGQIVVDRMSLLRIRDLNDFELKGRARYKLDPISPVRLEDEGREHGGAFRGPNSTLAVRGTDVVIFDQPPFKAMGACVTGTAFYRNRDNRFVPFGKPASNGEERRMMRDDQNAAEYEKDQTVVDPSIRRARDADESRLLDQLVARGAVTTFDRGRGITVVRGGRPLPDRVLRRSLPGDLNFVVRWGQDANLDITVGNEFGELLHPTVGLTQTGRGGRVPFDHQGGKNGGLEVAYWRTFDDRRVGMYNFYVSNLSGQTASASFDIFRADGTRIKAFDGTVCRDTFTFEIEPGQAQQVLTPLDDTICEIIGGEVPGLKARNARSARAVEKVLKRAKAAGMVVPAATNRKPGAIGALARGERKKKR